MMTFCPKNHSQTQTQTMLWRRAITGSSPSWLLPLVLGIFLLLTPNMGLARQGLPPVSRSQATQPLSAVAVQNLPEVGVQQRLAEDAQVTKPAPARFAVPVSVNITPDSHGTWEQLPDGGRLWRLRFHAPGATDLNFGFTQYQLPAGATLHVSSESEAYYEGPYTDTDNKEHGQLWTPVVPGDRAVIELYLPADTAAEPVLHLTQVGTGYQNLFRRPSLEVPKQGSCNIDVVCPQGDAWRDQIRSVLRYTIQGVTLCSGQLVNTVQNTFQPVVLSAFHCGVTVANAATVVSYFNYESVMCGDLGGGSLAENQTGATFRAGRQDVDGLLFEIDSIPDPNFMAYYTGWDRSGTTPQSSVGIHHPRGDQKAISLNDDPLTIEDGCLGGGPNASWIVDNWEQGTTEAGSSGSGLWDPVSKKVVGFLSGGFASCANLAGFDCYGRLSVFWDGPLADQRARDWLDPSNTGAMMVDGADPAVVPIPTLPQWGRILFALTLLTLATWQLAGQPRLFQVGENETAALGTPRARSLRSFLLGQGLAAGGLFLYAWGIAPLVPHDGLGAFLSGLLIGLMIECYRYGIQAAGYDWRN